MYILYIIVLKIKLITNLHALSVAIHVLSTTDNIYSAYSFKLRGDIKYRGEQLNSFQDWEILDMKND